MTVRSGFPEGPHARLSTPEDEKKQGVEDCADEHLLSLEIPAMLRTGVESSGNDCNTELTTGTAISPAYAAQCMQDTKRTIQFMRGVHQAISDLLQRLPDRPIHILYAGCGPYAPLVLPLLPLFSAEQVNVTLLDVHRASLDSVSRLIQELSLGDYVADVICADAACYQNDPDRPIHLLVVETMLSALEQEPQVAITYNLMPQLAPGGILIPERIGIEAVLLDPEQAFCEPDSGTVHDAPEYNPIPLGQVFELSMGSATSNPARFTNQSEPLTSYQLPGSTIQMPDTMPSGLVPMLTTEIDIYQTLHLRNSDSGLTRPRVFPPGPPIEPGSQLAFTYEVCERPGLRVHRV
ncbi:MAG: hypothetical protein AAF702_40220 [Chloroflexota bacterium]